MNDVLESLGKCKYCGEVFSNKQITRHLNTHLCRIKESGKNDVSFHLRIYGKYFREMFLNLLVSGSAKLKDLDDFLRDIWLECCGHMSSFTNVKERNKRRGGGFDFFQEINDDEEILYPGQLSMKTKVMDAFYKGLLLEYEYDFGSTTELIVEVVDSFKIKPDGKKILLLSRNEPLKLLCSICGKGIAEVMCAVCMDGNMFCKKCAAKHGQKCEDFADYAGMPVVNSPRMGVCGYEGGIIDIERDGIYKAK
jgi:hypothetical protein